MQVFKAFCQLHLHKYLSTGGIISYYTHQSILNKLIPLFIFALAACQAKQKQQLTNNVSKNIQVNGYIIPQDSIKPPVITVKGATIILKAGKPDVVEIKPEVYPTVGIITRTPQNVPEQVPGEGGFELPVTRPLGMDKITAGEPEVVPARLPAAKNQNPKNIVTFGLLQGLKNLNVHAIKQDNDGNLWIATGYGGICRYDGKSFSHFTEKQGLIGNSVLGIYFDREQNIWFGTHKGVSKFDGKMFTNYSEKNGLPGDKAYAVTQDNNGNIWIGTYSGLCMLNEKQKTITTFTTKNGLPFNDVFSILADSRGHILIGSYSQGMGIITLQGNGRTQRCSFKHYTTNNGIAGNTITNFYADSAGNIWLATSGGVTKATGITGGAGAVAFTNYTQGNGLLNNDVNGFAEDGSKNIWVATAGGVSILSSSTNVHDQFSYITDEDGLPNNNVLSIFKDKQDNIWLGNEQAGISRYNGGSFRFFQKNEGLHNVRISSIVEDNEGNMWLGTFGKGLVKYQRAIGSQPARFYYYGQQQGLKDSNIYALLAGKNGEIWIATKSEGLVKLMHDKSGEAGTFEYYNVTTGTPANFITSLMFDRDGNLWFGCRQSSSKNIGGACRFNGRYFTMYGREQGLAETDVWKIAQDIYGNYWFGSWGQGVTKFQPQHNNKGVFTHFSMANGLLDNSVRAVFADSRGSVWAGGVQDGGLTRLAAEGHNNTYTITHYTEDDGLTNNNVMSMLEDKNGNMWFGNYYGLNKIPAGITANVNSRAVTPIVGYTPDNGFQSMGCIYGSIYQSSNGLIWVGTLDRLVLFNPADLKADTAAPVVKIVGVNLFNEKISWVKDTAILLKNGVEATGFTFDSLTSWYGIPANLHLAYHNNFISFQFAGININTPGNTQYQYMLTGVDKNWGAITNQAEANYGNLAPATYVFKVKARKNNGNWSAPVMYTFTIRSPWFKTWLAYCMYIALAICVIYSFIYLRIQQGLQKLKAIEAIRTKLSSDLHDDVGTILSGLSMQSQMMAYTAGPEHKAPLNELSDMSRQAMDHMRDIVWAIDSRKDKLENLVDRMRAFAEKNLALKDVTHEFVIESTDARKFINPEKRQAIYLIFKEAITNVIKHSNATHVAIKFVQHKECMQLTVHDNGSGKNEASSDGSGISNMKMRAEKIDGQITIAYDNGYKIELVTC